MPSVHEPREPPLRVHRRKDKRSCHHSFDSALVFGLRLYSPPPPARVAAGTPQQRPCVARRAASSPGSRGWPGGAGRRRPTDKAAPSCLLNVRRGCDLAARQGRDQRQSRSRPRHRGRPAGGPRGDGLAWTKKRTRPRQWRSALASWLTSLAGGVRERGGPRPARWETGAGARGAEGHPSARTRESAGRSVPRQDGGSKRSQDRCHDHHLSTVRSPVVFNR